MRLAHRLPLVCLLCVLAGLQARGQAQDQAIELYARGEYQRVVDLIAAEPEGEPPAEANIQTRMLLARSYHHLGRLTDAVTVLQGVLEDDQDNAEANLLVGRSLYQLERYEDAVGYLNTALRLKREPRIAGLLGLTWYELDDLDKAKDYLEQSLAEDVSDPVISRRLGEICLSRGQGNRAEKYLLLARDAGDDSPSLHRQLAKAYAIQHKTLGPVLVRRIAGNPKPGQRIDGLLVLRQIEGQPEHYQVCTPFCAMYEGVWLLEKNNDDAEALFIVATGWMSAGAYERAAGLIDRLANAEGESRRVRSLRADLALAKQDWEALRHALAQGDQPAALETRDIVEYRYRAAMRLRSAGEYALAMKFLEEADAMDPTSAKVLRALVNLSRTTADRESAIAYYRRLIDLYPDSVDIDELRNALKQLEQQAGSES
ncbi:MAG: tetratricopeptide repeat protein [Phycisphaeraceae bacterium]